MRSEPSQNQTDCQPSRICYVYPTPLPCGAASAVQVLRMCEGFTQAGYCPLLIGRQLKGGPVGDQKKASLFEYYGIRQSFDVHLEPIPTLRRYGVGLGVVSSVLFACYAVRKARTIMPDLLYTRDIYTAWLAAERGLPVVFEEHEPPRRRVHEWMRRRLFRSRNTLGLVFISSALEEYYRESGLLDGTEIRTIIAHDAASLSQLAPARDLPDTNGRKMVIGYVGSILPGRGVELILSVAERFPEYILRIIGGSSEDVRHLRQAILPNVECFGFVEPGNVSTLFDGIDVLLMPYQNHAMTRGGNVSAKWMSPLKMFEYMASGVPLIASDLPVLREVLTPDQNCLMVAPDDVSAWSGAIRRLATDPELRQRLATNAMLEIKEKHNWPARAKAILDHLAPQLLKAK